jgi:hypothetical protein
MQRLRHHDHVDMPAQAIGQTALEAPKAPRRQPALEHAVVNRIGQISTEKRPRATPAERKDCSVATERATRPIRP